jgi:hypothetical protein
MRLLARSSALLLCCGCLGAGFFSDPQRLANLSFWESSEIGAVWSDDFNRTSLGTNWVIISDVNASLVGNELQFAQTNTVYSRQMYYLPWLTCSDQWTLRWSERFGALTTNSLGVGVGLANFQAAGGDDRGLNACLAGAGTNFGKIVLQRFDGTTRYGCPTGTRSFSQPVT